MRISIPKKIYFVITLGAALWCAGILAAPFLQHTGHADSAEMTYAFYSKICHQNTASSIHWEGEKFGVCMRCSAIYFGFLAGLLVMPLTGTLQRRRAPKPALLVAVIIPMVLDVVLNVAGLHSSTALTRIATGLLFGSVMPWCIVPYSIEAWTQLKQQKKIQSPDSGVCPHV